MGTRLGLTVVVVVAIFSTILPESHQYPQHVVFQPVTYQLIPNGKVDPDISLVIPPTIRVSPGEAPEDTSSQLICKKIQPTDTLFRVSPSTQASQLLLIPSPTLSIFRDSPFSRFFVAVPSSPSVGISAEDIQPEIPEAAFAPPPPLMASLCVSQDSPRPFPVLFAPPPPSQFGSIDNDFRNEMFMKPPNSPFYPTPYPWLESPLKVSLNTPPIEGVTLGIHGVPATVESSSPSTDDPSGKILVKLHTKPPGSITLGFTGDALASKGPEEFGPDRKTYLENGHLAPTVSPSVSMSFSRPVDSIGIGSPNSPAVNIQKQNFMSSNSPKTSLSKNQPLNKDDLYLI